MDAGRGFQAARADQAALDRERADPGEDIAAVLPVGDRRLVHPELKEQVVDVGVAALRRRHHRDLGSQRMSAAYPVDLHRVAAAHHREQQRVPLPRVRGQVAGQKVQPPWRYRRASACTARPRPRGALRGPAPRRPWSPGCFLVVLIIHYSTPSLASTAAARSGPGPAHRGGTRPWTRARCQRAPWPRPGHQTPLTEVSPRPRRRRRGSHRRAAPAGRRC